MRISVKDTTVHEKQYKDKSGNPQIIREQRAALDLGDGYELPFRLGLGSGPVYPVGDDYTLAGDSFNLGQYGDLQLSRNIKLVRVPAPRAAKAV